MFSGGSTYILGKFSAAGFCGMIQRARASVIVGAPAIYQALLDHGAAACKCPKRICRLSALPRNHLGKLVRAKLVPPA